MYQGLCKVCYDAAHIKKKLLRMSFCLFFVNIGVQTYRPMCSRYTELQKQQQKNLACNAGIFQSREYTIFLDCLHGMVNTDHFCICFSCLHLYTPVLAYTYLLSVEK